MKLRQITLCPFAGLPNVTVPFDSALTVVHGLNEAGKSTVFHALESVLFTGTNLTPARMKDFTAPYLPVGGGDTIVVELSFSHNGAEYTLRRQWGANSAAQLTLPDGNLVTSEDAIAKALEPILGASAGTYRSVLMTQQAGLAYTLNRLKADDQGTVRELADLLTAAVQETDGVSVNTFLNKVEALYQEFFSRWDLARNAPEGGRGIQNPWRNRVGKVLQAWYDKEAVLQTRDAALAAEEKVDVLNKEILNLSTAGADLKKYLQNHEKAVKSVSDRKTLEAKEALLAEQFKTYKQANSEWPVLENDLTQLAAKEGKLNADIVRLQQEKEVAARLDARKGRIDQLKRAKEKKEKLAEAKKKLESTPVLTADQLKAILKAASDGKVLEARLASGRLKACITAKSPFSASLQCGVDAPSSKTIKKGEILPFEANGVFKLDHPDWTLAVESGSGNFSDIARQLEQAHAALKDHLQAHHAKDEDDARRLNRDYEEASRAFAIAEQGLKEELGSQNYEELEAEASGDGMAVAARPLVKVAEELGGTQSALEGTRKELESKQTRLTELQKAYGAQDKLFEKVAEITAGQKELANQKGILAPLPDGITDVDAFVAEYKGKDVAFKEKSERHQKLELEKAGIHLPDESAEELDVQYHDRQEAFDAMLRRANAITRIRGAVEEVRNAGSAADPYANLKTQLETYIARLTGDRYKHIQMSDSLPSGFIRGDGAVIGAQLLSTGTKDVLGLALRLAMGGYFLGANEGFLVMDDPLVDMDPGRQAKAAQLLRDYAATRQVIVFTCQPGHAEILGGNRVNLA